LVLAPTFCTTAGAQPEASRWRPAPVIQQLVAPCRIVTSQTDLRRLAFQLQQQFELPIVVDRRVPPELPPRLAASRATVTLGPTLYDALEQLAEWADCQWATDGQVVLLAPASQAAAVMTGIMQLRQQWQSDRSTPERWLKAKSIECPRLTTPQELLTQIGDAWQVDVSAMDLPHDLLHEQLWRDVDLPAAVGLLAAGFGSHVRWDADLRQLRRGPLQTDARVAIAYPAAIFRSAARRRLAELRRAGAEVDIRSGRQQTSILAGAQVHRELQRALLASLSDGPRRTGDADAPTLKTFRVKNKSARAALETLAAADQVRLVIDPAAEPPLEQRIDVEFRAETIAELIAQVAAEVGLQIERSPGSVRVLP
jgi:hypothetical protein